mmetsp:Transcript_167639/g.538414  ORF Transcript_167639/g.538414 Transcript_167639/m.538414 type:complete len:220 (+) Transcript_167639:196-855(+)
MAKLRPHNSWITTPNPARASCIPDCACGSTRPSCRWTTRSPSDRARHRTGTAPEGPSWSCSPWEGHYGSTKPVFLSSSCSRRPSCNRSMWPPLDPGGSPCRHRVGSTRPSGRQASSQDRQQSSRRGAPATVRPSSSSSSSQRRCSPRARSKRLSYRRSSRAPNWRGLPCIRTAATSWSLPCSSKSRRSRCRAPCSSSAASPPTNRLANSPSRRRNRRAP